MRQPVRARALRGVKKNRRGVLTLPPSARQAPSNEQIARLELEMHASPRTSGVHWFFFVEERAGRRQLQIRALSADELAQGPFAQPQGSA